uniref:hypothetical protein n=1 Tax=Azorhizobium caulinodans TaxID=7 RepID=UPI002FBF1E07
MRRLDSFTTVALGLLTCIGLGIGAWALLGPDESQADPNLSAQSGIVAAARSPPATAWWPSSGWM